MTHPLEDYVLSLVRPEADLDIGPPPAELVSRLREAAIPLRTAKPCSGIDDLRPFGALVGAARVVGLGEATHGTAEFFTLKHRIFEFLVEDLGFTTFALETGFAETLPTCDYVLGAGNRDDAVRALPDTWSTPELVVLIEWMRARNASGRQPKLTLYGFDMQSSTAPVRQAMAVARRVDPAAARLETDLAPLASSFGSTHYRAVPTDARTRARVALEALIALVRKARDSAEDASERVELARAYILARSALRAEEYVFLPSQRGRDESMTATVLDILDLDGADSKVALWAHNAHIQRGDLIELVGGGRVPSMGELLHRKLGAGYVRISFAFDRGSFRARHLLDEPAGAFTVGPAPPFSWDGALAAAGHELAAFPLRGLVDARPGADWLSARPAARCISGATTDYLAELSYVRADPRISADVFVFVAETTASIKSAPSGGTPAPEPPRHDSRDGQAELAPELSVCSDDASSDLATATQAVAVSGRGARTVVARAELSADVSGWPAGGHLTLRYETTAPIDEQLVNPPFAHAPAAPHGAAEWQQYEVQLLIPEGVSKAQVGLALVGAGTARMRGLTIEVR